MGSKRKRAAREAAHGTQPSQKRAKTGAAPRKINKKKILSEKAPFPEELSSEDRVREATLYELLGSDDAEERLNAADVIIAGLFDEDGVTETTLRRHLGWRLFRGLASGRNASRLGFSIVITEILSQLFGDADLGAAKYPELSFQTVLDNLVDKTKPTGGVPGQEERDHYLGQLFGIECFVRAKILFREKSRWQAVLDLLLKLAKKKVWLRAQCVWIIIQSIPQMKVKTAEKTLQAIADAGFAKTPDGAAVWIVALDRFPAMQFPPKLWRDPLASKSLPELSSVLKDSGKSDSNNIDTTAARKQMTSNWSAQLHFIWDIILDHFKSETKDAGESSDHFRLFWTRIVDQGFFIKTATDSQKFSGFMIFQKFLEGGASQPFISDYLFSQNLMTCLMNQAAKEDRYLHRAANKAIKAVEAAVEQHSDLLLPVLQALLGDNGAYNFDQRTHTKTIEKLLQFTKPSNVRLVVDALRRLVLLSPKLDDAERRGQIYGDYLAKLTNVPTSEVAEGESSVAGLALEELTKLAYGAADDALPASTDKTKGLLRQKLNVAFARIVKRPTDSAYLCNAVVSIDPSNFEMDEEITLRLQEGVERLKQLIKAQERTQTGGSYQGFALLHAVALLELYNEEADALEILDDLKECYEKVKAEQTDDEQELSVLLVEILLSLLARPSSLMREVSQKVFEGCSELISAQALTVLTEPLAADESEKGQQALFSNEDEEMLDADAAEEEDEDEDEDEAAESDIDSDVEFVDLEDAEASGSAADEDEEDQDEDEDEDEEDNDDDKDTKKSNVIELLDEDLEKLLRSHRLDKDLEADSSEDESDMSDSEMEGLDGKLADVFRQRVKSIKSNKKKDRKDAKETVVNFKHRILDLLNIYVKSQPTKAAAWSLLVPLLELARTTKTKPLASKAAEIIGNFSKGLKKARSNKEPIDPVAVDEQLALLREIHAEAAKDGSQAFAKTASGASLLVATYLFSTEKDQEAAVRQVIEIYGETQASWTLTSERGHVSFFQDWIQWWGTWLQSHSVKQEAQEQKV